MKGIEKSFGLRNFGQENLGRRKLREISVKETSSYKIQPNLKNVPTRNLICQKQRNGKKKFRKILALKSFEIAKKSTPGANQPPQTQNTNLLLA